MAKRHHARAIGMLAVGGRSFDDLERDFVRIYTGEPDEAISPYQACNRVQSYASPNLWGLGDPEGVRKETKNADAWVEFLRRLRSANEAVEGGNLRAIISRNLMGLHIERRWRLGQIEAYVRALCRRIRAEELGELVAGWWLDDEGIEKEPHTVERWEAVLDVAHQAQKAEGCNFAFYFAEEPDSPPYWTRTSRGYEYRIPTKLKAWVEAFVRPDFPTRHDATPVLMPFYYPWAANQWKYGRRSPFGKWRLFLDALDRTFPVERYERLRFEPVLELSQQRRGVAVPGHVDVHRQIRGVLDLPRVAGVWFLGWNQSGEPSGYAQRNWTGQGSPRWAEAIQNEVEAEREGFDEAIPAQTRLLPNEPNPFRDGTRLPYELAERGHVRIEIRNRLNRLIRTIEEGETVASPAGRYVNDGVALTQPLGATSAYWDGRDDRGRPTRGGTYRGRLLVDGEERGTIRMRKR